MLPDLGSYARIARGLVKLVHQPCTPERAIRLIKDRMARREELFLQMVGEGIWQHPDSPYRRLLVWAGWTYDTIADSVRRRGLEATLEALRDSGVYLSQEEKAATKPIQRDNLVIELPTEHVFYNPRVVPAFEVRTGATRSRGTPVPATLDYIAAQRAVAWCLSLEALGTRGWPVVVWMTRGAGFLWWLSLAHMGRPPVRWFSITDISQAKVPHMHEAMLRLTQAISLTRGMRMPYFESVPLSSADVVLDSILNARRGHGGCAVVTTPSAATRLADMAGSRGVDLERVAFLVGGEPLTPGKHAEIARSGARVGARYNLTEAGAVGGTCSHPIDPDDVHLLTDTFALVPHKRTLPDGSVVSAFVLTALLPSSPGLSLNVETDDFGQIAIRRCGCLWDEVGMHTHLSNIRSFSKLTGEGVTVLGTDCVRVIEEVLPREFGGHSTDYQLLEVEDADHLTRLHLVVRPTVGPVDEERLLQRFVDAAGLRRMDRWQQARTIRVVRQEPVPTAAGKLLPFHTLAFTLPGKSTSDDERVRVGNG